MNRKKSISRWILFGEQAHASTADYEHLKLIAADRGLTPKEASCAEVKATADASCRRHHDKLKSVYYMGS